MEKLTEKVFVQLKARKDKIDFKKFLEKNLKLQKLINQN